MRVCAAPVVVQGPGQGKVQNCMAALLATLVLDDDAMEILQQRGEGHLVFEVTLKLVRVTGLQGWRQLARVVLAPVCGSV